MVTSQEKTKKASSAVATSDCQTSKDMASTKAREFSTKKPYEQKTLGVPTHEQIAQRAYYIWQERGCMSGRDAENWLEAEAQLRRLSTGRR